MIRYADRQNRPLPSVVGLAVSEATKAELAAKATRQVMEITSDESEVEAITPATDEENCATCRHSKLWHFDCMATSYESAQSGCEPDNGTTCSCKHFAAVSDEKETKYAMCDECGDNVDPDEVHNC